jgi:hypothetical protein
MKTMIVHSATRVIRNTALALFLVGISYLPGKAFFCSSADSIALVEFYNRTNGPSWSSSTNWLAGPVSTWQGVTVENDRVTRLVLPFNNLSGKLSYHLAFLQELKFLSLPGNAIGGQLPWELIFLQKLEVIDLSENQLSGKIPSKMGFLFNLEELRLRDNQFSGSIPFSIGLLYKLRILDLSQNQLTGSIPFTIGNLSALQVLILSENQLQNSIPSSIGNLKMVQEVFMSNNKLTGSIPQTVASMDSLVFFNVSSNQLSGSVPDSLINLPKFFQLNISNNDISRLPDLSSLASLGQLRVSSNQLTFKDLEPNISKLRSPSFYVPQDSVGNRETITVCEGDTIRLSADFVGTSANNRYQWFTTSGNVETLNNSAELIITNAQLSNAGTYFTRCTNTVVRGLTLIRRPVEVIVQGCSSSAFLGSADVFPVPFTNETTVRVNAADDHELNIVVRDEEGVVRERHTAKSTNTDINVGGQLAKPGVYYVDFLYKGKKETKRIIKQ